MDLDEEQDINTSFHYWPDTVLEKVLKNIAHCPDFGQQNLLNCRLVAVQWNEMTKSTSELMKQIKFPITDARKFLELPIVKSGKVKSIIIKNTAPLNLESDNLESFNKVLSNVVKVEFAFSSDSDSDAQSQLFQFILQKCTNLEELILSGDSMEYSGILCDINTTTVIAACNKISYISVNLDQFVMSELDASGLTTLVLSLPKLQDIKLYGICDEEYFEMIFAGLCEYIRKFRASFQLKKLLLNPGDDWNEAGYVAELIKLVNLCLQNHVLVDFDKLPSINLSTLHSLNLAELQGNAALRRPLFPMKCNGRLVLSGVDDFTTFDRLHSLNIGRLELILRCQVTPGELNWIGTLQNLDCLSLRSIKRPPHLTLSLVSVRELEESFTAGVHSLKTLYINYIEIFESTRIHLWPQYFPNLTEMHISMCEITPDNVISELTVLESLSQLFLSKLTNLTDVAFIVDCVDRFGNAEEQPPPLAPAITCFKSLNFLELDDLPLLTDSCVNNGIAKCKSLDKLVIKNCKNMTKNCLELMQCEVEFKYRLLG